MKAFLNSPLLRDIKDGLGALFTILCLVVAMLFICVGPSFLAGITEDGPIRDTHRFVVARH